MRKQKIIKMTASPLDPSLGGSFQPPATHNGDISIVFRDKDVSIHGWDGSAWSTIYTRNGNDKQFAFPHTYENYYVKSLTGSDEAFSASFFSVDEYQGSTPLLAGVQRDLKLHDVDEVPIYTASDVNKFLTVMSDGSLRWLGISESYVVEVIGSGEETPAEENPQVIAGTFLEELQSAADNAQQNAEIVDGVFFRTKAFNSNGTVNHDNTKLSMTAVDLEADGIISYTNNVADTGDKNHVEFSLSFWVKPVGSVAGQVMFTGLGGGFNVRTDGTNDITVYYPRGGGLVGLGKAVVSNDTWTIDEWEHICLVVKEREDDPTKWAMYIYKGGQPLNGGNWIASTDSKLIPDSNINSMFGLGGQASTQSGSVVYNGMDGSFYLDSFQIAQGVVLADEQVAAIAAQTDRQMSIETASGGSSSVSAGSIVGLEEDANLTLHGNAQLIDGVLHVDGTSGTYASLPHSLDYERENGDLTVSMWIKPNSLPSNWNGGLVSKMGTGWSGWITAVSTMDADGPTGNMTQGGLQTSFFGGGNANNRYYPENGIALNEWQHVAFVMVAVGEYKMYHNGVEILSYNPTNRPQSTTGALRFGGWGPFNGYEGFFDGQIDGIKIEKVAKTADDILNEFNAGSSSEAPATSNDVVPDGTMIGAALAGSSLDGAEPQEGLSYVNEVLTVDENFTSFDSDTSYLYDNAFSFHVWFKYTGDGAYNSETMFSFNQHLGGATSPPSHRSYWVQIPLLNGGSVASLKWTGNANTPSKTIDLDLGTSLNDGNWHLLSFTVSYTSQTETSVQAWLDNGAITGTGDLGNSTNGRAGSENIWGSKTKGLVLGGRYEGPTLKDSRFSGQLTQATVSNEVITLTDVQNIYANPPS